MKREYESVVIFDGSLTEDVLKEQQSSIEQFLSSKGEITQTDVWGKRTLAYPINKIKLGYYVVYYHSSETSVGSELLEFIKHNEKILRTMTVKAIKAKTKLTLDRETSDSNAA